MCAINHLVLLQIFIFINAVDGGYKKGVLPTTCNRKTTYRKIGCFHDRVFPRPRPLDYELLNIRDIYSDNYNGPPLAWQNYPASLHMLACQCAYLANQKGYLYFGLQFWGECWSGPSLNYSRDGKGEEMDCRGPDFKTCNDNDDRECVGVQYTNYIYSTQICTPEPEQKVEWADWNPWTPCSASCGGGQRQRTRDCKKGSFKFQGQKCEGESIAMEKCNEEKCAEVCRKELDLGIVIDASASVGTDNYQKMKDFIIKLVNMTEVGVKVGVIHYASTPTLDFRIGEYTDRGNLIQKIEDVPYTYGGGTRTDKAFRLAEKRMFLCKDCTREDVPYALIVITDGISNYGSESMDIATKNLKEFGVTIMAVGVGFLTGEEELKAMASDPDKHVFHVTGFNYFTDVFNELSIKTCEIANFKS